MALCATRELAHYSSSTDVRVSSVLFLQSLPYWVICFGSSQTVLVENARISGFHDIYQECYVSKYHTSTVSTSVVKSNT